MSFNTTTLSAAITASQPSFGVASATGIVNPNFTANPLTTLAQNVSYAICEQEVMQVTALSGTVVSVLRGYAGTRAVAHSASTPILFGLASDFGVIAPSVGAFSAPAPAPDIGASAPLTGATITPTGAISHFTGTTALVTINPPTGYVQGGKITIIFDGSSTGLTWTAADNISVAGTATTAKSAVEFFYDQSTSKWIPSRLA